MRCHELNTHKGRYNGYDPRCSLKAILLVRYGEMRFGVPDQTAAYCWRHIPESKPAGIDLRTGKAFRHKTLQATP